MVILHNTINAQTFSWESVGQYKGGNVKTCLTSANNKIIAGVELSGVYTSSDNGNTWISSGVQNTTITSLFYNSVTNQYYAGTDRKGLFVSKDEGATWLSLVSELMDYKINDIGINSLGNTILICTNRGLFACSTEGTNLVQLTDGLGNEEFYSLLTLTSGTIFVSSTNGIFTSITDHSFSAINAGLIEREIFSLATNQSGIVYAGGVDGIYELSSNYSSWRKLDTSPILKSIKILNIDNNENIYAGDMKTLYISRDAGKSFQEVFNNSSLINSITFNTNRELFVSTETGLYSQKYNTWSKIGVSFNLFINQLFYDDNSFLYSASTNGLYKINVSNFEIELITSNLNMMPIYNVTKNSYYIFIATTLGIYRSSNEGVSWMQLNTGLTNFNINCLVAIGSNIFCGTKNGLFVSTDNGNYWTQINSIPITVSVNSVLKINENNIIAGTSLGLYISDDAGKTWKQIKTSFGNIDISFLDINNSFIIAGTHSTLYCSYDNGNTWFIFSNNINKGLITSIAINPFNEIYIGTNQGVFRSLTYGQNWVDWIDYNNNLSNLDIRALKLIGNTYLFAGTYGGSFFTSPLLSSDVPVLISPNNHSIDQSNNITLTWSPVPNSILYRCQISLSPNFSNLVSDRITYLNSIDITNLEFKTKYYWRINSSNTVGESLWSDVWNFTTLLPTPAATYLVAPIYDSVVTSSIVFLKWNESERSEKYNVQISLNSNFDPYVVFLVGIDKTEVKITNLELFQTYYWRVQGTNISGNGNWSLVSRFILDPFIPATPILLYPQKGSHFTLNAEQNEIILKWNNTKKAEKYWLSVATDIEFKNIVIDENSITDTFFVLTQLSSQYYWWKVKALNEFGEGAWSEIYEFLLSSAIYTNKESEVLPYSLSQNFPNPFNPETTISFSLSEKQFVSICIFDIHGKKVASLVNDIYEVGQHSIKFIPHSIASGIYYYQIKTSKFVGTKKMVYIK